LRAEVVPSNGLNLRIALPRVVTGLVDGSRARVWIHGHTHDSFDYFLNGTRVVCKPRGYVKDGVNENPLFDANFLVKID
jgi:hypothetical protein